MPVKKCFDTLNCSVGITAELCDAFSKFLTFLQLEAREKARSPWLQMRAIGRLGKVRLLAPPALRTPSDKKHLTFSVWKSRGHTLCVL